MQIYKNKTQNMQIIKKNWDKTIKYYAKDTVLKEKNSVLKLEKDFTELKDIEVKIKTEIDELYLRRIIMTIDNMDKFEQKIN